MISINQHLYIESLVENFRLTGAKKVSTPMDPNVHFSVQQCPLLTNQVIRMRGVPYSEAIGSILWPTIVSCPDTAYAVKNPVAVHTKSGSSTLGRGIKKH